jgi:hypothetical protein
VARPGHAYVSVVDFSGSKKVLAAVSRDEAASSIVGVSPSPVKKLEYLLFLFFSAEDTMFRNFLI